MSFASLARSTLRTSTRTHPAFKPTALTFLPTLRLNSRTMAASAAAGNGQLDLLSEIVVDHNNIKDLFKLYSESSDYDRKSVIVNTIIREIAVHSEAEEITIYNSSGLTKEDSKSLRDEHQELEEILYSLDYTKLSSPEFGPKFKSALKHFIQHSDHEERGTAGHDHGSLTALAQKLSGEDNHKLAQEFVTARKVVPTRPHPMAPQNGGLMQKILGLGTKIPHDKIVETLQGKTFIPVEELRFQHPAGGKVEPVILDSKLFD